MWLVLFLLVLLFILVPVLYNAVEFWIWVIGGALKQLRTLGKGKVDPTTTAKTEERETGTG
jgi:hypothetical protein